MYPNAATARRERGTELGSAAVDELISLFGTQGPDGREARRVGVLYRALFVARATDGAQGSRCRRATISRPTLHTRSARTSRQRSSFDRPHHARRGAAAPTLRRLSSPRPPQQTPPLLSSAVRILLAWRRFERRGEGRRSEEDGPGAHGLAAMSSRRKRQAALLAFLCPHAPAVATQGWRYFAAAGAVTATHAGPRRKARGRA